MPAAKCHSHGPTLHRPNNHCRSVQFHKCYSEQFLDVLINLRQSLHRILSLLGTVGFIYQVSLMGVYKMSKGDTNLKTLTAN